MTIYVLSRTSVGWYPHWLGRNPGNGVRAEGEVACWSARKCQTMSSPVFRVLKVDTSNMKDLYYFIAETKGSMSTLDRRKIENCKIKCARKFFAKITSEQVKYDVVDDYTKLMELVK